MSASPQWELGSRGTNADMKLMLHASCAMNNKLSQSICTCCLLTGHIYEHMVNQTSNSRRCICFGSAWSIELIIVLSIGMSFIWHHTVILSLVLALFRLNISMKYVVTESLSLILMRVMRSQSGRGQGLFLAITNRELQATKVEEQLVSWP